MSVQINEKIKIDYAILSNQGLKRKVNNDSYGKYPEEHSNLASQKGQLFIVADSKSGNPGGRDAGKMSVRIVKENYFTYPSDDITFCLQRAFDTANRQIYQYAQANNLHRKIGATCSALALTDKFAYIAHVGDCRIFRVSVRKIEQLTMDHTRVVEKMVPTSGKPGGKLVRKPVLARALGVRLGIKVDTVGRVPVDRDEYFVLCSDGMRNVSEEEIQTIVLSSSPRQACRKLVDLVRQRGGRDDTTVQVIKVYNHFQEVPAIETYAHISEFSNQWSNWPIYFMLGFLVMTLIFLLRESSFKFNDATEFRAINASAISYAEMPSEAIIERRLADARLHLEQSHWNQALIHLNAVLRMDPQQPEALKGVDQIAGSRKAKGDEFYRAKDWVNAQKYYRRVLQLQPDNTDIKELIVRCDRMIARERSRAARNGARQMSREASKKMVSEASQSSLRQKDIEGIYHSHWSVMSLKENEDFRILNKNITFKDNLMVKKAFHYEIYDGVEVEAVADVQGPKKGKFGIIFGHETTGTQPYKNFLLFYVNGYGEYSLVEVRGRNVRTLVVENIRPDIFNHYDKVHLKVKSFGKLILLYANGELLKMIPVNRARKGGVGLYSDPKINVEFSNFKISPAIYEQK